jgi:hypothetical protein
VVIPAFMAMCLWQVSRALGGNELSWAYVFEWPLFAVYAVYMWWRLLHEPGDEPAPRTLPADSDADADADGTDAELAAYNEYLSQLADRDRAAGR